jgi:hypothetical protein
MSEVPSESDDATPGGPEPPEPPVAAALLARLNAGGAAGMAALADGLEALSGQLDPGPEEGPAAPLALTLARAARALRGAEPATVVAAVDRAARRHPYRAMLAGAVAGWALGRLLRRRRGPERAP